MIIYKKYINHIGKKSHKNITKYHQNIIKYHKISQNITKIPQNITKKYTEINDQLMEKCITNQKTALKHMQ